MSKDYYKILGVTEFESAENIKSAYRKLARKWHPDIAGNNPETLLRFKEINEAYEILSNKVKKEEYDRARQFYNYARGKSEQQKEQPNNTNKNKNDNKKMNQNKSFSFKWEDFINRKQQEIKYKKEQESKNPKRGDDIYADIEITVFEALSGTSKTINVLQTELCPKCNGHKFVNGNICSNCKGSGELATHKKLTIKIPAEIKDKSKIRLAGEGSKGKNNGANGDLYITIHIKDNNEFKTEGLNIYKKIKLEPYQAVLGTNLNLYINHSNLNIKIAPNTQNGQKIRLAGGGLVQNNKIGDIILIVEIRIPADLTEDEINLYKQLEILSTKKLRNF